MIESRPPYTNLAEASRRAWEDIADQAARFRAAGVLPPLGAPTVDETAKPKPLSVLIAEHEAAAALCDQIQKVGRAAQDECRRAHNAVCERLEKAESRRLLIPIGGKLHVVVGGSDSPTGEDTGRVYGYYVRPVAFAD